MAGKSTKKPTTEEWKIKAKLVHGDKYEYDEVEYVNSNTPIKIYCRTCNDSFMQKPINHTTGSGCPICGKAKANQSRKNTTEWFIEESKKIWGDKFNYSKTSYNGRHNLLTLICKKHGEFECLAGNHLRGADCYLCSKETLSKKMFDNIDIFKTKAFSVHGDDYDYSLSIYKSSKEKLEIYCRKCRESFWQSPNLHLQGNGCPKCHDKATGDRCRLTKEEFISRCVDVFGPGKFDYTNSIYKSNTEKLKILCNECGEYFWKSPGNHLFHKQGCPNCSPVISKGEERIKEFLKKNNIEFTTQEWFKDTDSPCKNPKTNCRLPFDFYLPEYNKAIEYQGSIHYEPHSFNSDQSEETKINNLRNVRYRDGVKAQWCAERKNISLLEIKYTDYKNIDKILIKELGIKDAKPE